jgi:hypothetical protein
VGRFVKRVLKLGVLAGASYAVWRWFESRKTESGTEWEAQPFPYPPQPRLATEDGEGTAWVESVDGACPATHPVKAKLSSGIFHVPGGQSYDRTKADRCYRDAEAAEADGLRQAAR